MRIVQISKSELENQVNGKKMKSKGRKRTVEEIVVKICL